MNFLEYIYIVIFAFVASALIVATMRWHGGVTIDHIVGVQKFHTAPTPRVGGIAIGFAVLVYLLFFNQTHHSLIGYVLISSVPMVLSGLGDDITNKIGPRIRMLGCIISGFIYVLWTGYIIGDIQFPVINLLFHFEPIAIIITAIALAGIANAINIIDGYHGLACGSVAIMFGALALLGWRVEDQFLVTFSLVHLAATVGFMGVNFPLGRLFLGDGGAYYLGFSLGANAVMLFERNPDISPWTVVIVITYPIIEILYSIYRKFLTPGHSPDRPDRIHFHHLLYRTQVFPFLKKRGFKQYANPVTGLIMWLLPLFSAICAQIGFNDVILSVFMFFSLIAIYLICYAVLGYFATQRASRH